jgi:hypothetical protein
MVGNGDLKQFCLHGGIRHEVMDYARRRSGYVPTRSACYRVGAGARSSLHGTRTAAKSEEAEPAGKARKLQAFSAGFVRAV